MHAAATIKQLSQFEPAVLADTIWSFGRAEYFDFQLMAVSHCGVGCGWVVMRVELVW